METTTPNRWVGLDLHKEYLVATGVSQDKQPVFGPARVPIGQIEPWAKKSLTKQDAVILEMTTNTWQVYDLLLPLVHSVTVVHPPHVALIVKARVMTDKKAALALAQLHAAGLLPGIWVPDQAVRDLRAIVEQRRKQVNLVTTLKNRLHAVLHRHDIQPPTRPGPVRRRRPQLVAAVAGLGGREVPHPVGPGHAVLRPEPETTDGRIPGAGGGAGRARTRCSSSCPASASSVPSLCWRPLVISAASLRLASWSAMPAWARRCMTAA